MENPVIVFVSTPDFYLLNLSWTAYFPPCSFWTYVQKNTSKCRKRYRYYLSSTSITRWRCLYTFINRSYTQRNASPWHMNDSPKIQTLYNWPCMYYVVWLEEKTTTIITKITPNRRKSSFEQWNIRDYGAFVKHRKQNTLFFAYFCCIYRVCWTIYEMSEDKDLRSLFVNKSKVLWKWNSCYIGNALPGLICFIIKAAACLFSPLAESG